MYLTTQNQSLWTTEHEKVKDTSGTNICLRPEERLHFTCLHGDACRIDLAMREKHNLRNKSKMNTCRQSLYSTDNEVGYSKQRKRLSTLRIGAASKSHQNIKRMSVMRRHIERQIPLPTTVPTSHIHRLWSRSVDLLHHHLCSAPVEVGICAHVRLLRHSLLHCLRSQ